MSSVYFPYKKSKVHYHQWGEGKKLLICLHGFGETSAHFAFLREELSSTYQIVAIDLPWHGKTAWQDGLDFEVNELVEWIKHILQETGHKKFSLMGYSMGGRIALSITAVMAGKMEQLILCAPDGLTLKFWYWFSTQTYFGNKLFRFSMKYPGWFLGLIRLGEKTKILNQRIVRYVHHYLDKPESREQLYRIWTTMRKFRPDLVKIKSLLVSNNIHTTLFFGKFDRIIPADHARDFRLTIEGCCDTRILESGHQFMNEKFVKEIAAPLLHNIAE